MTIIEQTTIGKKSQATNEDGIHADSRFVAVVDGSTSKTPIRIDPLMTNGQCCMHIVKEVIAQMPADISCEDFCQQVTCRIHDTYLAHGFDIQQLKDHPEQRTTASCVVYSERRKEVWMIGDCQCLIDGVLHGDPKPQEEFYAEKRAAFIRQALSEGHAISEFQQHDAGRDLIVPAIIESCRYQNVLFSVFDGFPVSMPHVSIVSCQQAKEIVLASDGYPFLMPTLQESEERLADLLRDDPLCISIYKASKGLMQGNRSFDDRSYVRFTASS